MFFYLFNFLIFLFLVNPLFGETTVVHNLKSLISKIVPFRSDGKFDIPKSIQHIKLDIGLSYNAPMSQYWLSHEKNLLVFGFEPNPESINSILNGATKLSPAHGNPLEKKFIGTSFFLIPCALGLSATPLIKFFVTKADCGCSSIYYPKSFIIKDIITVPIFPLSDFFDLFPFDTHPIIEYIKIDAQGCDLNIIKSSGEYLREHVIFITLEAENNQYENTVNSEQNIDSYMKKIGFIPYNSKNTKDPTYLNSVFLDYSKEHNIKIYQS